MFLLTRTKNNLLKVICFILTVFVILLLKRMSQITVLLPQALPLCTVSSKETEIADLVCSHFHAVQKVIQTTIVFFLLVQRHYLWLLFSSVDTNKSQVSKCVICNN